MTKASDGKSATREPNLAELFAGSSDPALADKIAELERHLEDERDRRREDRFLALVVVLALVDIILLQSSPAAVTGIVFVLQLVLLAIVAKRLGVEQIAGLMNRLVDGFAKKSE